jgi:hypothetical protein
VGVWGGRVLEATTQRHIHRWFWSWITFNLNQIEGDPL